MSPGRSAGLGRDIPQGLLEQLARLTARDEMLAIDDHCRHGADAELLPEGLGLPYRLAEFAPLEDLSRPLPV